MHWVEMRIAEAQTTAPVDAAVVSCLKDKLSTIMRERTLTRAELTDLAKELIAVIERRVAHAD